MSEQTPRSSPAVFASELLGYTPHPKQIELLETAASSPLTVVAAGRRFGKSLSLSTLCLWYATTEPASSVVIASGSYQQSRIIFDEARDRARSSPVLSRYIVERLSRESSPPRLALRDGNGKASIITALTAGALSGKTARGHGADLLVLDEAALMSDEAISQTFMPMLATSAHRLCVMSSTPWGTTGSFAENFQRGLNGFPGVRSLHYTSADNPLIDAAWLKTQQASMTDIAWRTEYLAEFTDDKGAVFSQALIQSCIDRSLPVECRGNAQSGHKYVAGIDPAKFHDRSAFAVLDITRLNEPDGYAVLRNLADIKGPSLTEQAGWITSTANDFRSADLMCDSAGIGQAVWEALQRYRNEGTLRGRLEEFKITGASKPSLIGDLVMAMEQGQLRIPAHPDLLKEFRFFRYELTQSSVKYGAARGQYDDYILAVALAWQMAKQYLVKTGRLPLKRYWLSRFAPLYEMARADPIKRAMQDAYAREEGLPADPFPLAGTDLVLAGGVPRPRKTISRETLAELRAEGMTDLGIINSLNFDIPEGW